MTHRLLAPLALAALFPSAASAQWSPSPAQNLSVADGSGAQVLPKLAATSDGGCYLGWFDNRAGNYDVRLQRLDAAGNEQWPHNGVLVSGNPQSSSLVDWDLIADSEDHCVLTFTDVRAGGDLDVYAYRVAPSGAMTWGAQGVTLSQNADFEPDPRVCEASDGDFVFAWANGGTATIQVQRLDRAGSPRYPGDGVAIPGDAGALPGFCRIAPADGGAVILSWVRTIAFFGNKHVHAQKVDVAGNQVWNSGSRIAVFDGGSVPIAHAPRLIPDGSGGAVCSWHHAVGNQFFVRVQRVDALGNELFLHDGVAVGSPTGNHFDPAVTFRAATQETFVVWNERNLAQSQWGITAQKLDFSGAPMWGAAGSTLLPISGVTLFAPTAVQYADGVLAFVLEESLGITDKKVLALRVDGGGASLWAPPVEASNVASDKLRLQAAITPSGSALLAWADGRAGTDDVVVQNVNATGVLGDQLGATAAYGCGGNPVGSLTVTGRPAFGATLSLTLDNPLASQSAGSLAILVLSLTPDAAFPCGTPTPGLGMNGGNGEVLLDLAAPLASTFGGPWSPGSPVAVPVTIPNNLALFGAALFAQGVILDAAPGSSAPIGLTTGARMDVGF